MRELDLVSLAIVEVEDAFQAFRCEDALDAEIYLQEHAVTHHQQNTAHTRLVFDDVGDVIGFFTVLTDLVQIGKAKRREHGWDLDAGYGILPAIRLHYIAVDSRHRNLGYGKAIIAHAMHWCKVISERVGCNFITIGQVGAG